MSTSDLWSWQAVELSTAIRAGEISAREAALSCLARFDAVNPSVNAVVDVRASEVLTAADAADDLARGGGDLGLLHGIPVTTKLNVDQAGSATSNGVVALRDNIAGDDGAVVGNLRTEGAILLGRTNVPAFSWRWFTDNALHGRTLNPWQQGISCGGSSGGAAVAVATGICPISQGSDLAGSIRYPAYVCGVVGLRPTFGRVPQYDGSLAFERPLLSHLMLAQGPLARSVDDVELALRAMSRPDPRDPWQMSPALSHGAPAACRVALVRGNGMVLHPAVSQALDDAARTLSSAGYTVEEASLPHFDELCDMYFGIVTEARNSSLLQRIAQLGDPSIQLYAETLDKIAPRQDLADYIQMLARRNAILRDWQLFLQTIPLLLMPVSCQPPFADDADLEGEAAVAGIIRDLRPIIAINLVGLPALAMPTGLTDGVPMGVQLVGSRFDEMRCLAAGRVLEAHFRMPVPIDPTQLNAIGESPSIKRQVQ